MRYLKPPEAKNLKVSLVITGDQNCPVIGRPGGQCITGIVISNSYRITTILPHDIYFRSNILHGGDVCDLLTIVRERGTKIVFGPMCETQADLAHQIHHINFIVLVFRIFSGKIYNTPSIRRPSGIQGSEGIIGQSKRLIIIKLEQVEIEVII